jgi:hypothetical protein
LLSLSLLLAQPLAARADLLAEFTLSAAAPSGFPGPLAGNWTAEDRGSLPAFAKHTVYLAPAADYYVRAIAGGWDFAASEASGPDHTAGCDTAGCDIGWLNLFFIHDDRGIAGQPGNETDAFGDPTPFFARASRFATADAAIAAASWHWFDVKPNLLPGGPAEIPVTFYIYDGDYSDNLGGLTLEIVEGPLAPIQSVVAVTEPAAAGVTAIMLALLLASQRDPRYRSPTARTSSEASNA